MMFKIYSSKTKWLTVPDDSEEVRFDGFEDFTFFVHRAIHADGFHDDLWSVSESSTGMSVVKYQDSKRKAIEVARFRLEENGIEKIRELINDELDRRKS